MLEAGESGRNPFGRFLRSNLHCSGNTGAGGHLWLCYGAGLSGKAKILKPIIPPTEETVSKLDPPAIPPTAVGGLFILSLPRHRLIS
jgi:hypothetical protein